MITLAEWKIIGIILMVTFFISAVVLVIMSEIATRIKNKTKKCKRQQVNHKSSKNSFKIDYDEFIRVNFKKQEYLFENRNRRAELVRLVG
jgi:lipopolysaccharide export LptBFGC system permease protein LptF